MNFKRVLQKAFVGGTWYVGYRKKGDNNYSIIPENSKNWIADPFLFEYKGEHFLFVEYIQNNKGVIAYYKFINDIPVFQKVIIEELYHLSYPCVFEYQSKVYMIPESADHHTIDLYVAENFPEKWKKITTLYNGICYDTTVLVDEDNIFIFVYEKVKKEYFLKVYNLDIDLSSINLLSSKLYRKNTGRPAGNILKMRNELVRVIQDCSMKYGEKLIYSQIKNYTDGEYEEIVIKEIEAKQIDNRFQRVHTYNQDNTYEVVDFFKEKLKITRPFNLAQKKIIQKLGH